MCCITRPACSDEPGQPGNPTPRPISASGRRQAHRPPPRRSTPRPAGICTASIANSCANSVAVNTRHRRQGHATAMATAALAYCRATLGPARVLITCAEPNTASRRVIEANGGILENTLEGECRYWVDLTENHPRLGNSVRSSRRSCGRALAPLLRMEREGHGRVIWGLSRRYSPYRLAAWPRASISADVRAR